MVGLEWCSLSQASIRWFFFCFVCVWVLFFLKCSLNFLRSCNCVFTNFPSSLFFPARIRPVVRPRRINAPNSFRGSGKAVGRESGQVGEWAHRSGMLLDTWLSRFLKTQGRAFTSILWRAHRKCWKSGGKQLNLRSDNFFYPASQPNFLQNTIQIPTDLQFTPKAFVARSVATIKVSMRVPTSKGQRRRASKALNFWSLWKKYSSSIDMSASMVAWSFYVSSVCLIPDA